MINYTANLLPPDIQFNNSYLSDFSNQIVSEISRQKDKLLFQVLSENNIDVYNLTELSKNGRFIQQEGKDYQLFQYNGKNLLRIYEPDISCEDYKFKVEVKYKKLY